MCLLSDEAVGQGQPAIVREESKCDDVLPFVPGSDTVNMPFELRAAIRFSSFRIVHPRISVCPPADDAAGNDTVSWMVQQKEPKLQWSLMQLIRAAAGNQQRVTWQQEDTTQSQPREDLRGFIDGRKVSSAELKKKLSQSLSGNAEGLGQIGRYGARDCKQGEYVAILSSLSYSLFVRIRYKSENEVEWYRVFPPLSQVHLLGKLLMADLENVTQDATHLQTILPVSTPPAFHHLVRFIDSLCSLQGVPITTPIVFLRTPAVPAETTWQLVRPQVLQQTMRSLVFSADHFDGSGVRVVIKAAAETSVASEEAIHHLVDGAVRNIRRAIGRVRISGGAADLAGLVLEPFGEPVTQLLIAQVDDFVQQAATVLEELHKAGIYHRDVKVRGVYGEVRLWLQCCTSSDSLVRMSCFVFH